MILGEQFDDGNKGRAAVSTRKETQMDDEGSVAQGVEKQVCVLLVEDDNALRRLYEVRLQRAGYKVSAAANGLDAMKFVHSSPIDIVITDAMMPTLSGYEFCRLIRNSPQLSHIKIILVSGLPPAEGSPEKELPDAFLSKPFLQRDLIECIERLLTQRPE